LKVCEGIRLSKIRIGSKPIGFLDVFVLD